MKTKQTAIKRPITTLFMLMSVDGKISTGNTDECDFDKDIPTIDRIKDGLQQYYDIEKTTDLWSLNSGRVQAKVGVNEKEVPNKTTVSFVIIDNNHLKEQGIRYFCGLSKEFVLVTTNKKHEAFNINEKNLHIIYQETLNLVEILEILKSKYNCKKLTIQTGGTLNGLFLREKLIDYLDIIVVPLLVGGKDVSTLIDGEAISSTTQLGELGILQLENVTLLKNCYLRLKYKVIS